MTQQPADHPHASAADSSVLRVDVVEQIMRMTDEDIFVIPYLAALPGSIEVFAATGRLLAHVIKPFPLDTPLSAWVTPGSESDPFWRERVQAGSTTLWGELEFLREFIEPEPQSGWCCPYRELETLRSRALEHTEEPEVLER